MRKAVDALLDKLLPMAAVEQAAGAPTPEQLDKLPEGLPNNQTPPPVQPQPIGTLPQQPQQVVAPKTYAFDLMPKELTQKSGLGVSDTTTMTQPSPLNIQPVGTIAETLDDVFLDESLGIKVKGEVNKELIRNTRKMLKPLSDNSVFSKVNEFVVNAANTPGLDIMPAPGMLSSFMGVVKKSKDIVPLVIGGKQVAEDAVSKLTKLVKEAVIPKREILEISKSQELSKKIPSYAKKLSEAKTFEEAEAARSALKGELIKLGEDIVPIADKFTDVEKSQLLDIINKSAKYADEPLTRGNVASAVRELIDEGKLPTEGEIKLIQDIFGKDLADSLLHLSLKKPQFGDWVQYAYYNSLLSGSKTHIINTVSNTLSALLSPVERLGSAVAELPIAALKGRPRERLFGEVAADAFGILRGIPEGVRLAVDVLKSGAPLRTMAKWEMKAVKFPKVARYTLGIPTTLLEMGDAFMQGINKTAALRAEAYRTASKLGLKGDKFVAKLNELINNPTREMLEKAYETAEYRLFRAPPGDFTKGIMKLRDALSIGGVQPLRFVIPFLRTPVNLVKFGLERSPLGILNPKMWQNIAKLKPEAADQIARWAIGSMVASAVAMYVADDKITGAVPKSVTERDRFYREGKIPFAIKIGDKWISYQRVEPLNQAIAQVAAVVEAIKQGKEDESSLGEMANSALSTIGKNIVSQTYFQSLSDLLNAMEDPERYGGKWAERIAASIATPYSALLRTIEQDRSKVVRDPQNVLEAIESNIPVLAEKVPAKLTALGEEAERAGSSWFPIQISEVKDSPLISEMEKLNLNIGFVGNTIWGVELDKTQQNEYQKLTGEKIKQSIEKRITDSDYQKVDNDDWKRKELTKVAGRAREEVKDIILDKLYEQDKITGDNKLIYEYDKMLRNPKIPENLKATYGTMIREQRPDIDVALNLSGAVRTVRSPEALALLKEECDKRGIPFETMPAVLAMIEPPKETTTKKTTTKKSTKKNYAIDNLPKDLLKP